MRMWWLLAWLGGEWWEKGDGGVGWLVGYIRLWVE